MYENVRQNIKKSFFVALLAHSVFAMDTGFIHTKKEAALTKIIAWAYSEDNEEKSDSASCASGDSTCAICLEPLTPRTTVRGTHVFGCKKSPEGKDHLFCKQCIRKLHKRSDVRFVCPICRHDPRPKKFTITPDPLISPIRNRTPTSMPISLMTITITRRVRRRSGLMPAAADRAETKRTHASHVSVEFYPTKTHKHSR